MRLYRLRPVIVSAVPVTGANWSELAEFCGPERFRRHLPPRDRFGTSGTVAQLWHDEAGAWCDLRIGDLVERGMHETLTPVRSEHIRGRYAPLVRGEVPE